MNITDFFTYCTGLTATLDQIHLLNSLIDSKSKYILICAGRQTGKTLCCAVAIMYFCFELKRPIKILLVAVDDQKSGEAPIYSKIKEIFKNHPEFRPEAIIEGDVLYKRGFETKSGVYVYAKNAIESKVRGTSADVVFCDEAGLLKPEVIMSAYDCLSGETAKFIVLSTPPKLSTHIFNKWLENPEKEGFEVYHWSEETTNWHSSTELAFKLNNYSSQRYKTEVQGLGLLKAERTYFLNVDDCVEETATVLEESTNVVQVGTDRSHIWISIDWGISPCPTVIGVVEKLGSRFRVLEYQEYLMELPEEFIPKLAAIIHKYDRIEEKPRVYADSKPIKFRGWLEHQRVTVDYVDMLQHKEFMYAQLQDIFKTNHIRIPDSFKNLILELKKYHPHKRTGDDWVDALAMACYQPQTPLGKHQYGRAVAIPNAIGSWSY
jgi:hypothetical protein